MTKQTSQIHQPRSLWLERLERRWMLHAHTDFFSVDHDDHHSDFGRESSSSAEVGGQARLEIAHRSHRNSQSHGNGFDHFGEHRIPQSSERFGIGAPQPSQSAVPILAPLTVTVIVILEPITFVRPPTIEFAPPSTPSALQINAFQNSAPTVAEPADIPDARSANVDSSLLTTIATDAGNQTTAPVQLRGDLDEGSIRIQAESLVSIQQGRIQSDLLEEPLVESDTQIKVRPALASPTRLEVESVDNWLSEFSKVKSQWLDLEAILDDLASRQDDRDFYIDEVASIQRDWKDLNLKATIVPGAVATADEMIWLAPVSNRAASSITIQDQQWSEGDTAQWTMGVGWYQSFEFADPADADAVISDSPPIMVAAATTSELVLDLVRQPGKEGIQIPISRSVSYAFVAVSVASWQVLQRRKRRNDQPSADRSQLKQ
jgi:hypothetical protein